VVRSADVTEILERVPNALVAENKGPEGWSDAVLDILRDHLCDRDETA